MLKVLKDTDVTFDLSDRKWILESTKGSTKELVNGVVRNYYKDIFTETPYKDGEMDGVKREYHSGILLKEFPYKNGKREGNLRIYCPFSLKLKSETPYKDDKIEGIEKEYDKHGRIVRETPYEDGKREGLEKWYYDYGTFFLLKNSDMFLWREIPYKDNKREGIEKRYYKGQVVLEIPYKDGEREGYVQQYKRGRVVVKILYKDNEPISGIYANGRVLTNAELIKVIKKPLYAHI